MILMYASWMDGSEWTNDKKLSKVRRKKSNFFIALHFLFFAPSSPPFRLWLYVSYMRHFTGFISRYEYYFVRLACLPSSFVLWFLFYFQLFIKNTKCKMWCWFTSSQKMKTCFIYISKVFDTSLREIFV